MIPSRMVGNVHGPSAAAKGTSLYSATPSAETVKSTLTVSNTFFLGLSTSSASPMKPSTVIFAPLAVPVGGMTSSVLPSALVPQRTMAADSTPRIFDGFMFDTQTTRAPVNSSSVKCLTKPLTTWRGASSPRSISSTYKDSASGWRLTLNTVPTTRLRRETSTGAFAGTGFGAGAFFFASIFSASNFANRTSPMAIDVPTGTFSPNCLSCQIFTGAMPSLLKTTSDAWGIYGCKKCMAMYTASIVLRMMTALRSSAPSPLTAHGAASVRYLFVSFAAPMASSQAC
mmetsp:Transcript_1831/g.6740  ORF Transcript_1831/g.6740 Transcript_1831/m.6740 type:complete len:285 (+) Transcript_1831:92-946(+)